MLREFRIDINLADCPVGDEVFQVRLPDGIHHVSQLETVISLDIGTLIFAKRLAGYRAQFCEKRRLRSPLPEISVAL